MLIAVLLVPACGRSSPAEEAALLTARDWREPPQDNDAGSGSVTEPATDEVARLLDSGTHELPTARPIPGSACAARGLSTSPSWVTAGEPTASAAILSTAFGKVVADAGDVNADGFDDVVSGAYEYSNDLPVRGAAYLYLGNPYGDPGDAAWRIEGAAQSRLGYSVAGAGDVNADGFDDVVIGASDHELRGAAFLYLGGPEGLLPAATWSVVGRLQADIESDLGRSVAGAGDVNADGFDDVVVGAADYGDITQSGAVALLYLGGPGGLSPEPAWRAIGSLQNGVTEAFAVGLGDINGDGFDDVGVAHEASSQVAVFQGTPNGLTPQAVWEWSYAQGSQIGTALDAAGDVNADGIDDFAIGAYLYGGNDQPAGRVFVFLGGRDGFDGPWFIDGELSHSWFGASIASVGDANCDGFDDLLVGEPMYIQPSTPGRVSLVLGGPTQLTRGPSWGAPDATGLSVEFGKAVAGAGDLNGDGLPDAVVGSSFNGNGRLYAYLGE